MIEIIFKFNSQKYNIEYNEPKTLKEICEDFAQKHSLDKNDIFLIYKDEEVNLNTELYVEEQFNLLKNKTKKILEFSVCKRPKFQIIFASEKKVILKVNKSKRKNKRCIDKVFKKSKN